jgi:hypothetical protein
MGLQVVDYMPLQPGPRLLSRGGVVALLALLGVQPAGAQYTRAGDPDSRQLPVTYIPGARERADALLGMAAVNGAIGATTAVLAKLVGKETAPPARELMRAAAWGAAGGSITFAGKWLVSGRAAAGWLGRPVAAMGSSMVHGAAFRSSPFDQIILPFGPFRLYSIVPEADSGSPRPSRMFRMKVDAAAVVGLAYELSRPDSRFDLATSLQSGATVFEARERPTGLTYRAGEQYLGTVRLANDPDRRAIVLRHELVHVIQYDQRYILWGSRLDRALFDRVPRAAPVSRWIDLGLIELPWGAATDGIPYDGRPWEREAHLLTEEGRYTGGGGFVRPLHQVVDRTHWGP